MRNTKLSRSKEQVVGMLLGAIQCFIEDNPAVNEDKLKSLYSEICYVRRVCEDVRAVDRTSKLDRIVQSYFGEETTEDLLAR